MKLYEAINSRRTVREFEDEPIATEVLERIIESAFKAPTNDHMRDWHFIIVRDKNVTEKLLDIIPKGISDDDMEAFLFLTKPKSNKDTFDEITKMLDERGVKAGLNVSNIKAMIIKGIYDREIKIASAIKPVEGHDGYYEYSFDIDEVLNRKPKIREDGSVDYTSMCTVGYLQFQGRLSPFDGLRVYRYHLYVGTC